MISIKNKYLKLGETFNTGHFEVDINFTFKLKYGIINKFQIVNEENQFQDFLQNFKDFFFIKLQFLTIKKYLIFELKRKMNLEKFDFKTNFFEISGIMPKFFIKKFNFLCELLKWAENILNFNSSVLEIKYDEKYEISELSFSILKGVEEIEKILNKLIEIENTSSIKITELKWYYKENSSYNTFKINFEILESSKLTLDLLNKFAQLINSDLFPGVEFYLKDERAWISLPEFFSYNLIVSFNELFDNIDKYIKFFNLFKSNRFINLIVSIIGSSEVEKCVKNYLPIFEKFEENLSKMDGFLRIINL